MNITDISIKLHIEQSTASQHLAILRKAGFVNSARQGKTIMFSVDEIAIREFLETQRKAEWPPSELDYLYKMGIDVFGSKEKFAVWLDSENRAFGKIKPKKLLNSASGINQLKDELKGSSKNYH